MAWTSDGQYGGFSSCSSPECKQILSSYKIDLSKTNVKVNFILKKNLNKICFISVKKH
jgi:hypothetical protein